MKGFLLVIALFYSTFFFGQNRILFTDIIQVEKDYFKIQFDDSLVIKNNFNSINYKGTQLLVYNSFSKHTDVYFLQNGDYHRSNPKLFLENNFRSSKIDSFNPYGSPNIGSAIVLGVINVFIDKLKY